MCLLTVFTPDAEIDSRRMYEASLNNPDGFGFAMLIGDHITRFRSMDYNETIGTFAELRDNNPGCWAVFHHRFSTGGGETVENCHPFTWSHDERIMVAHNGVLPIKPGRRKSDTRIWAEHNLGDVDPAMLDDTDWWTKTESWMGSSKAAFLSVHPDTEYAVYIMNEHLGHWEDGVWWSNRSYEMWRPSRYNLSGVTSAMSTPTDAWSATTITCGNCNHAWDSGDDYAETNCAECGFCWICEESSEHCMCWTPTAHAADTEQDFLVDTFRGVAEQDSFDDHFRRIAELSLGSDGP